MGQTARPGFLGQIGQDPESLEDDNEDDVDVSAAAALLSFEEGDPKYSSGLKKSCQN